MYKRKDMLEDENLDWDKKNLNLDEESPKNIYKKNNKKHDIFTKPIFKHKNKILHNRSQNFEKKGFGDILKENFQIFLLANILILPYLVGFTIIYFLFSHYGNVPFESFFNMQHLQISLEMWFVGFYLFLTIIEIWLLLSPKNKK